MILSVQTPIQFAKGVGEKRSSLFAKIGLKTFGDALRYFPRDYEDRSKVVKISELENGVPACFLATVNEPVQYSKIRQGLELCKTRVSDDEGTVLELTFFNAAYVKDALRVYETYIFYGKLIFGQYKLTMQNPVFEKADSAGRVTGRILPVYSLTAGLTQGHVRNVTVQALEKCRDELPELLPAEITERHSLCDARFAYENIHFPKNFTDMQQARRRLVFEELLVLQLGLQRVKQNRSGLPGKVVSNADLLPFYKQLPYLPTNAQRKTLEKIGIDLKSGTVCNRLIQGDVGSGKTLVAAGAAYLVCRSGMQTALMAPTSLLCEQHYESLAPLMENFDIKMGILTGAMNPKKRKDTMEKLKNDDIDFIVGTHALFSEGVSFANLGLCVTDEQHRFGVSQRQLLAEKGNQVHRLVMSATPIPRTLAHIMYGDLELSVMDELPPGRQNVDTFVVDEGYRERINAFIRKQVKGGRQVFIVCPLIEDENETGLQAAAEYFERLRDNIFPDLTLGLVHGKQKAAEQEKTMRQFAAGELQILVATTVIEVGVNVPNASLMIVENAERFGLSQLHQLRGRVGRGAHKSYCVLFLQTHGEVAKARLEILRSTNDGFVIAEKDLALRGPGDFFGERQHGLPAFELADLSADTDLLTKTREEAEMLVKTDPKLENIPALREAVRKLQEKLS